MSDPNWPLVNSDGGNPAGESAPEAVPQPDYPQVPTSGGYPPPPAEADGPPLPPQAPPYLPTADPQQPPVQQPAYPPAYPGQPVPPAAAAPPYPPAQPFVQQPAGYPQSVPVPPQPATYSPADPYGQPAGYPPADPYGQPAGYPPQSYTPVGPTPNPMLGGAPLADWPKRALGGLIDYVAPSVLVWIVVGVIPFGVAREPIRVALLVAWWAYLGYKNGTTGVTLGKSIAKLKVVSEETGQLIGVSNGIVRQLAHLIDDAICAIGWLFPLWDAKRQTIADKLVKTVVIDNSADPNAGKYTWWP